MATSGSTDFTLNRDEIVTAALRKLGVVDSSSNTPDAVQMANGVEALNLIVKSLQNYNIFLWSSEWITTTLTASTERTGTDGNIYTCIRSHTTALSNKPVTGADYLSYWVQRGDTGGVWAADEAVTSVNEFDLATDTLSIDKAFYRDNHSDTPIKIVGKEEFLSTYDKTIIGRPRLLWLEKRLSAPHVWLWPIPDQTRYIINMQRTRKLQDFDDAANTADFPERWLEFLVYRLAQRLAPEYGISPALAAQLRSEADTLFILAKAGGREVQDEEFMASAY